jgi:hypothetical protein
VRDVAPEFVARSLHMWPAMARPATIVQRTHEGGTDERLADALRKLIG